MGTIDSLSIGKLEVAWSNNEFLLSHNDLYQADCLRSMPFDGDDGERPEEWYELSLELVKKAGRGQSKFSLTPCSFIVVLNLCEI